MPKIISVNLMDKRSGEFGAAKYSYFCEIPVAVGDVVCAPTKYGDTVARVAEVDVPEIRIDERIMPKLKTITALARKAEAQA